MLRRPLTTLTITPEDIADYEDRLAEKVRIQARFVARRDREERRSLGVPETRRRVIPSSSPPSPPPLPQQSESEEEEEISYYARAQQQARQVSLSFQGQQTPVQGGDGDEDVEMMSAPPLPPSTGVPLTRAQARMGGHGEMETPSGVRGGGGPVRRSAREREREAEVMGPPPVMGGRVRAAAAGAGGRGRGQGQGQEMVTPETRTGGRTREERIGAAPPQAPIRGRRGE